MPVCSSCRDLRNRMAFFWRDSGVRNEGAGDCPGSFGVFHVRPHEPGGRLLYAQARKKRAGMNSGRMVDKR